MLNNRSRDVNRIRRLAVPSLFCKDYRGGDCRHLVSAVNNYRCAAGHTSLPYRNALNRDIRGQSASLHSSSNEAPLVQQTHEESPLDVISQAFASPVVGTLNPSILSTLMSPSLFDQTAVLKYLEETLSVEEGPASEFALQVLAENPRVIESPFICDIILSEIKQDTELGEYLVEAFCKNPQALSPAYCSFVEQILEGVGTEAYLTSSASTILRHPQALLHRQITGAFYHLTTKGTEHIKAQVAYNLAQNPAVFTNQEAKAVIYDVLYHDGLPARRAIEGVCVNPALFTDITAKKLVTNQLQNNGDYKQLVAAVVSRRSDIFAHHDMVALCAQTSGDIVWGAKNTKDLEWLIKNSEDGCPSFNQALAERAASEKLPPKWVPTCIARNPSLPKHIIRKLAQRYGESEYGDVILALLDEVAVYNGS